MILIHDTPHYRLGARVSTHPVTGATLQLFAKFPAAQHPRWQQLVCLTLPHDSFVRLSNVAVLASTKAVAPLDEAGMYPRRPL